MTEFKISKQQWDDLMLKVSRMQVRIGFLENPGYYPESRCQGCGLILRGIKWRKTKLCGLCVRMRKSGPPLRGEELEP